MLKVIGLIVVLIGAFAGGFYAGIGYRDKQIEEAPEEFIKQFTKKKIERVKRALLEDD